MSEQAEGVRPATTVWTTLTDQGAMLLDLRGKGRWYVLTPTGARWWREICEGATPDRAADRVAAHYGAAPEQVRADMQQLARALAAQGLLRRGEGRRRWWRR